MKFLINIFLCFSVFNSLHSQTILTLDEAIKMGLEKNFQIQITKNQTEISKTQNNLGNAGMSPSISLNGSYNFANLNSHQEFNSGVVQDKNGAVSNNLNASLNAAWTIFDGTKMFAVKRRLNANEQANNINLKMEMENLVYKIMVQYYLIVKINSQIKYAKQNLAIVEERNRLAKLKFELGKEAKTDYLLASINENKGRSDLLTLENQLINSKLAFNLLLNKSNESAFETNFLVSDSITVSNEIQMDDLRKNLKQNNQSILLANQNQIQFQESINETKALQLPQVQLNASYNFLRNQSQAGIVFLNRQFGINAGLGVSWLLFNGNKNNKLIQEKGLLFLNQKLITDQISQIAEGNFFIQEQSFLISKKILNYESQNISLAKELMTLSMERYKQGRDSFIFTLEAQKNLEEAQSRIVNVLYNLKISEIELMRISGVLVK